MPLIKMIFIKILSFRHGLAGMTTVGYYVFVK